eukprot:scaffold495189_cov36-Prasinocladus_malaysianus.AAC.1
MAERLVQAQEPPHVSNRPLGASLETRITSLATTFCECMAPKCTIGRKECKRTQWTPIHIQPLAWSQGQSKVHACHAGGAFLTHNLGCVKRVFVGLLPRFRRMATWGMGVMNYELHVWRACER